MPPGSLCKDQLVLRLYVHFVSSTSTTAVAGDCLDDAEGPTPTTSTMMAARAVPARLAMRWWCWTAGLLGGAVRMRVSLRTCVCKEQTAC